MLFCWLISVSNPQSDLLKAIITIINQIIRTLEVKSGFKMGGWTCCCSQTHLRSSSGCELLEPAAAGAPWPRCGPASLAPGPHFVSNLNAKGRFIQKDGEKNPLKAVSYTLVQILRITCTHTNTHKHMHTKLKDRCSDVASRDRDETGVLGRRITKKLTSNKKIFFQKSLHEVMIPSV